MGLAITQSLLTDPPPNVKGCCIYTVARSVSDDLKKLIHTHPDQVKFIAADLSEPESIDLISKQAEILDGVDAFISNAGIGTEGLLSMISTQDIQRCIQVNLTAPILLTRQVVKGMISSGGSIVFISSIAARTGLSGLSAYAASKGGLLSFSKTLAREYGSKGIRSNCVLPGFLETDMNSQLPEEQKRKITSRTCLKRLGHPSDVVGLIRFLLSDEAKYTTGAEFTIDGGSTA